MAPSLTEQRDEVLRLLADDSYTGDLDELMQRADQITGQIEQAQQRDARLRALQAAALPDAPQTGTRVQPGQQLASVVPLDDIWVTANFKETQLKYMQKGQRAEIKADVNGRTYKAHVDSIAGSSGARLSLLPPENATGNYVKVVQRVPVKITLDPGENADHSLRLGMSVEPKVFVK